MTIRKQLLLVFGLFAVLPLLAIGTFDHFQSTHLVEDLLATHTATVAARSAGDIRQHLVEQDSDLGLLSENVETQRWLTDLLHGGANRIESRNAAEAFLSQAWMMLHTSYLTIRLRPASGDPSIVLGDPESGGLGLYETRPIHDSAGKELGTLEYVATFGEDLRGSSLNVPFDSGGANIVYDRQRDVLVYRPPFGSAERDSAFIAMLRDHHSELQAPQGAFLFREDGQTWQASFVSLVGTPLSVVATASLDEFAGPFLRTRTWDFALLVSAVVALTLVLAVLLHRLTTPLVKLTAAAERVADGDLTPSLPEVTHGEVGRLAGAFSVMVTRIGEMIRQVETNRQMAVLGEFAAQLSHEIRNPLTAVKINLQGLERDANAGRLPTTSVPAVTIALREVQRLDTVVHGVLRMARMPERSVPYHLHPLLRDVLQLIGAQADRQGVRLESTLEATADELMGDHEAIRGAVLNLVLNALEAQMTGGFVHIGTRTVEREAGNGIELRISDGGVGVSPEHAERVLQPFFTTKTNGTGLGLPLALRAVRSHDGVMSFSSPPGAGMTVLIILPLATVGVGV